MRSLRLSIIVLLFLASVVPGFSASPPIVDEPLGARYSLGITLWHLGHNADMITRFHAFLKKDGLDPDKVLPASALKPPTSMTRILLEPELLGKEKLNGWQVRGDYITGRTGDGPTVSLPLHVPTAGLYRLWVLYNAKPNARGVTSLKIYCSGQEQRGPICQTDEFYDQPVEKEAGPTWKSLLVDLPAGNLVVKLGHIPPQWHGSGSNDQRQIDCLYLTDELWAAAPTPEARKALREANKPEAIQWTVNVPLEKVDLPNWKWWQVRPLSWEDSEANPKLFALSRAFWSSYMAHLSAKEYDETKVPDYRAPERQVIFVDSWNLVANPVRARRQMNVLNADISRTPLPYQYVWHDIGGNIKGLSPDGKYDPKGPYAGYGGWYGGPGRLEAGWGTPKGTVSTDVPVTTPGKYAMWVLSNSTNLSYTAPWYGKVTADGREQFTYDHAGKIPTIWMKMGDVTVTRPGNVRVDFTLDGAASGTTYRRIYTLFLVNNEKFVPKGTIRPPWTMEMYRQRAAQVGANPKDTLLMWISDNPYRPLSQEVWAEQTSAGDAWPYTPQRGTTRSKDLLMARDSCRAVQVAVRNLVDNPTTLTVAPGPLTGKAGSYPDAVTWRAEAFVPYGADRQAWTPFFLMRRATITVPPLNIAGIWLTVNTTGVPAGEYESVVRISGKNIPEYAVVLKVRVSSIRPEPQQPVLVDGWSAPHEGEAYMRDFVDHGMNVWSGEMSKADMQKWGIKRIRLVRWSPAGTQAWVEKIQKLGLDYDDYFVGVMDEPGGTTVEALKGYLETANAIRAVDPKIRICFNPSESAEVATFKILAPYCDFWCPYSKHVFSRHYGNPEKKAIYLPKPWMWYTTPCLWDKTAREPGIRTVPSQPGNCVGVAFFALNYPWRDQWDTGYEHIRDASTMGAVISRHGPVATIVWEQIREASQEANLAMMVRERLGVKTFDEVIDPAMQRLIREADSEELIRWLEEHPAK